MRYINPKDVEANLPDGWEDKAQNAHEEVKGLCGKERAKAINDKSDVWKELKDVLKNASDGKCWYCESRQERSDNAVDHYRPKNRVAKCPDHEGYWWLAFEWSNYRYSCTFCNSRRVDKSHGTEGGKHDHFPLWDENKRALTENDDANAEQPLLLDPMCPADPLLLWFDEEGQAVPRMRADSHPFLHERAAVSVELYHLNQVDAVERRKILAKRIKGLVKNADYYFTKYDQVDEVGKKGFSETLEELYNAMDDTTPYSAAARATLMGLRGESIIPDLVLAET